MDLRLTEDGLDFINEASLVKKHQSMFEFLTGFLPMTLGRLCVAYRLGLITTDSIKLSRLLSTVPAFEFEIDYSVN